jgi:hypothetical protein
MKWEYAAIVSVTKQMRAAAAPEEEWTTKDVSTLAILGSAVAIWTRKYPSGTQFPIGASVQYEPHEDNPTEWQIPTPTVMGLLGRLGWELVSSYAGATVLSPNSSDPGYPATISFPYRIEYIFKRPVT